MTRIFDGFTASDSWMEEFLQSEELHKIARETTDDWEDDVIKAVKERRYGNVEDALFDLRQRTGLTETAMSNLKSGILKKVAYDKEWHAIHGTTSNHLTVLAEAKRELASIANELDEKGNIALADALDKALQDLP